jgi:alpha-tubulin suppressor-like RCC1 family protein
VGRRFVQLTSVVVAAVALWIMAGAGVASASSRVRIFASIPTSAFVKSRVVVSGSALGARRGSRIVLQRRMGSRWETLAHSRVVSKGRFTLAWKASKRPGSISVRVALTDGRYTGVGRKQPLELRQLPLILKPAEILSMPQAGHAGWIILNSSPTGNLRDAQELRPDADLPATTCIKIPTDLANGVYRSNNYVGIGYSKAYPDGYLGLIDFTGCKSGKNGLYVSPVPLSEAYGAGPMNFDFAHQVAGGGSASSGTAFSSAIPDLSCSAGGSVSLTGSLKLDVKPQLKASFSLFKLDSASFLANGSATATLTFDAHGTSACAPAPVTSKPVDFATFEAQVGPFPVVVVLRGEITVDASISASADATGTMSITGSLTGGATYANGQLHGVLGSHLSAASPSFTVSGDADASGTISPKVSALLYGLAGPSLSLSTGINVAAKTGDPDTWSADAPLDVYAGFDTSELGADDSGSFRIWHGDFGLANGFFGAAGKGGGGATPPGGGGGPIMPTPGGGGGVQGAWQSVSVGFYHTCGLISGGSVDCWGVNESGELGDGTNLGPDTCEATDPCSTTPVPVNGITGATQVSAGEHLSCALLASGSIDCWGYDQGGELGDGNPTPPDCNGACSFAPVAVSGITDAKQVSVDGDDYGCAVLSTGTVECWGSNDYGQLGNGTTTDTDVPVPVSGIANATEVIAGGDHQSCALLVTGSVECWGANDAGQLGDGTGSASTTPVPVSGISNAVQITGGPSPCALLANGSIVCWGYGDLGGVGDGSTSDSPTPVAVTGISDAISLSSTDGLCAVLATGDVACWGANLSGALGDGSDVGPQMCDQYACSTVPVIVSGITDAVTVSTGESDACALLSGGALECWGLNQDGELGDDSSTDSDVPVSVSGPS